MKSKQSLFSGRLEGKQFQEEFFDEHPVLYPWPDLLVKAGLAKSYKLREVKFKKYLDLLGIKKNDKVLDVGCGQGIFLARIVKTYEVDGVGVDISKNSIRSAKQWESSRLRFRVADATKLPFPDKSFNYVLSFDLLEHIQDQSKALSEMVRVLKPGGSLLIHTINQNQDYTWNFWLAKLGVDIYQRVAHQKNLFLKPEWVKKELEKEGVRMEKLELFNAFSTLIFDEIIMILIALFKRLNFFSPSRFKTSIGKAFLSIADLFSRHCLQPLEVLEYPWRRWGYSNSFFVLGRKR